MMPRVLLTLAGLSFCLVVSGEDKPQKAEAKLVKIDANGKRSVKGPAPEWFEAKVIDFNAKPEDSLHLMIEDVILKGTVVPSKAVAMGAGEPVDGPAGMSVAVMMLCHDKKKREYARWTGAVLKDDRGNTYKQVRYQKSSWMSTVEGKTARLDGNVVMDVFFFPEPDSKAKEFFLELPGENVGVSTPFKIKFTAETVKTAEAITNLTRD
jgi:hypothetical protein